MNELPYRFLLGGSTFGPGKAVEGVRSFRLDARGVPLFESMSPVGENPMFLARVDDDTVAIVHETSVGHVTLHRLERDVLTPIGASAPTAAAGPCHIAAIPGASAVAVANYAGTLSIHRATSEGITERVCTVVYSGDGPDPVRQAGPHPHQAVVSSDRASLLVPDLGADTIHVHQISDLLAGKSAHIDIALPAGSGPRHLVVDGSHAFVANELSRTVLAVDLDTHEVIASADATAQPRANDAPGTSAIRLTTDGRLFVANRGPGTISVLTWDKSRLSLERIQEISCGGVHPRDIALTTDERYLLVANQWSNTLSVFAHNATTGNIVERSRTWTPSPGCVLQVA